LKLNNAISLLQQSLEIFLKAKIAEVSPFLLIAGDPQSWPSPNKLGQVEFSDFRTLDAAHLCRSARIVSTGLTDQFVQFYTRLSADSDEAGRVFRFESGHHSDLKAAGVASPSGSLG
jgi:hypothetical protein